MIGVTIASTSHHQLFFSRFSSFIPPQATVLASSLASSAHSKDMKRRPWTYGCGYNVEGCIACALSHLRIILQAGQ
eukprot:1816322-Rhodomonas_salina.2